MPGSLEPINKFLFSKYSNRLGTFKTLKKHIYHHILLEEYSLGQHWVILFDNFIVLPVNSVVLFMSNVLRQKVWTVYSLSSLFLVQLRKVSKFIHHFEIYVMLLYVIVMLWRCYIITTRDEDLFLFIFYYFIYIFFYCYYFFIVRGVSRRIWWVWDKLG